MSDELSNATRIAALEDYNQRLLSENVRLTNEAAEVRHELDNALNQGAWLTNQLDQCHTWIDGQNVRSDFQTATAMRAALDRERERCGVLEDEVKAWHAAEGLRKDEPHNEFMRLAEARFRTRETHALDAAKFGKEQNDG